VLVDGWGVVRIGMGALLAGVTMAGCGGGHSHTSAPDAGATGAQVAAGPQVGVGAGGPPTQPVINAAAPQAVAAGGAGPVNGGASASDGSSGAVESAGSTASFGGQGSSLEVIGFPVGPLLPTAVDGGKCQAARFADKSVYAQIAVARATCAQVPTVAAGADRARGSSYSAAGFACVALAHHPTNGYWISDYVSYSCRNGDEQIAFNWGTSSSAF
jgi:hypothetical protein